MKVEKKTLILTTLVCLIPVIMGVIFYNQLPEQMATHWGFSGEPNGYSSKAFAVFGLPGMLVALNLFLPWALKADPKNANMSKALFQLCLWIIPVVSVLCGCLTIGYSLGYEVKIERIIPAFVGLLFIIIGNYLPKTKQSYTMGIKLPWTLHSEENWNRTHRLGGFLWVVCGALFVFFSFFGWWNIWLFFSLLFVMIFIPCIYSYLLYRKGI